MKNIELTDYIGSRVKVLLSDNSVFEGDLVYLLAPEDEEEHEMVFIDNNLALKTEEIKKIELIKA